MLSMRSIGGAVKYLILAAILLWFVVFAMVIHMDPYDGPYDPDSTPIQYELPEGDGPDTDWSLYLGLGIVFIVAEGFILMPIWLEKRIKKNEN